MEVLNTGFSRMAFLAREYCELVDNLENMAEPDWLVHMADLLPRLHEAVSSMHTVEEAAANTVDPDIETRFELFSRIYKKIGERDGFHPEHDTIRDGQRLSGSLADDLTDIYFDLLRGLELLDQYPKQPNIAIHDWQHSFSLHWRHHLIDAERQLSAIQSRGH